MTTQPDTFIPQVTLGWRLQMSLQHTTVAAVAEHLGVSRQTVSRWMHDSAPPKIGILRQWAAFTGVDERWLIYGEGGTTPQPPSGQPSPSHPDKLTELTARKRGRARNLSGVAATHRYPVAA